MIAVRQITREVDEALRTANEVFFLDHGPGVEEYLRTTCRAVTDLYPKSYVEGESRINAYDRMSAIVLDGAVDHAPVTFAMYGHPRVYVYPTSQIIRAAPLLNLTVEVLAGISALDMMIVELGIDPGFEGLQMYEATDMLVRKRPLQPDVPCIIWQPGAIESNLYTTARSLPTRFHRLAQYLAEFYPADHEMTVVTVSDHAWLPTTLRQTNLHGLGKALSTSPAIASLYIPAVGVRQIYDTDLAAAVESEGHLSHLTSRR